MAGRLYILLVALRPKQWTKNALLLLPFFFALGDPTQSLSTRDLLVALTAAALFCMASSAIYLINDLHDREQDRAHPEKRFRPIASGALSPRSALFVSLTLHVLSLPAAWLLSPHFGWALFSYFILQYLYTFRLKDIAGPDIITIALGFLLRILSGALVLSVTVSKWLMLCTILLALFLALCKRRQEKVLRPHQNSHSRPSLQGYNHSFLNAAIIIVALATIVVYSLYTVWPDTVQKYGSLRLTSTIPFVIIGILRYLYLVFFAGRGERPEQVLLSDLPLMITVALYMLAAGWALLV